MSELSGWGPPAVTSTRLCSWKSVVGAQSPSRIWAGTGPDTRPLRDAILRGNQPERLVGPRGSWLEAEAPEQTATFFLLLSPSPTQSPQPADPPPSFLDCLLAGFKSSDNMYNPIISLHLLKAQLSPAVPLGSCLRSHARALQLLAGSPFPHQRTRINPLHPAAERIVGTPAWGSCGHTNGRLL